MAHRLKEMREALASGDLKRFYRTMAEILAPLMKDISLFEEFTDVLTFLAEAYPKATVAVDDRARQLRDAIRDLLEERVADLEVQPRVDLTLHYKTLIKGMTGKLLRHVLENLDGDELRRAGVLPWTLLTSIVGADPESVLARLPQILERLVVEGGYSDAGLVDAQLDLVETLLDHHPAGVLRACVGVVRKGVARWSSAPPSALRFFNRLRQFVDIFPELSEEAVEPFLDLARKEDPSTRKAGFELLSVLEKNRPGLLHQHLRDFVRLYAQRETNTNDELVLLREALDDGGDEAFESWHSRVADASSGWVNAPPISELVPLLSTPDHNLVDLLVEHALSYLRRARDRVLGVKKLGAKRGRTQDHSSKSTPPLSFLLGTAEFIEALTALVVNPTPFVVLNLEEFVESLLPISISRAELKAEGLRERLRELLRAFREEVEKIAEESH
ncbi:MAG: hypothetical protein Kow0069_37730 [Promethearchaeota archaeon]